TSRTGGAPGLSGAAPGDRPGGRGHGARDPEFVVAGDTARTRVVAAWKAPDGSARRGRVWTTSAATAPGDRIRIWTDGRGAPATRPMDAATARTHAVLAGVGVTLLVAGAAETARRLTVWRMVRRRYVRLDRAWAAVGPDWGRTGTGS
ncbi:hypothetical protein ABZ371_20810, partial [Streptomyces sp. NPDC005899]